MYGATKEQWDFFVAKGLTADLLPVVSNPNAKIAPYSSLGQVGKVPSKYNNNDEVCGITDWTTKKAKPEAIANWSSNLDYGICVQTRYLRAFDVDVEDELVASEIKHTIADFFPDPVFRTRPNSSKFLFPFFLEGDFQKRVIKLDAGIIEFLANGQQFIAAGTHPSGSRYDLPFADYPVLTEDEFEDLFNHLILIYEGVSVSTLKNKRRNDPDIDIPDEAIDYIKSTQKIFKTQRNGYLCVECPNHAEHTPGAGSVGSTVWMPAGTRGYPHGGFKCSHGHCGHITTQFYLSQIGYYDEDFNGIDDNIETAVKDSPIIIPDGLIKDTVDWITSTAMQPHPELALLNTLAFAGAVFGRRYGLDRLDTRTNIYTVGIAETGGGKDHSRKKIMSLAEDAGLGRFIGHAEIKSGQGVPTALSMQPSMVMMLDEFGMLLESISNSRAESYMRSVTKIFTQLYSSSNVLYKGGVYSDKKKDPIIIQQPNLCIYGTSTLVSYRNALTDEAVHTGELNRYIVIKPLIDYPEYNFDARPDYSDRSIIDRWAKFNDMFDIGDMSGPPTKTKVDFTFDLRDLLTYQRRKLMDTDDGTAPLYARYAENSVKIAMIMAIADEPNHPVATQDHMNFARNIMDRTTDFIRMLMMTVPATKQAHQRVFGDNPYNSKVFDFINQHPRSKREIYRKFNWVDTKVLDTAVDNLIAQGQIKSVTVKSNGRPSVTYEVKKD